MNERIKLLRKTLGLTQKEFGEKIFLSQNAIAFYENGKRMPDSRTIALICDNFSVAENWLRIGDGDMFAVQKEKIKSKTRFEEVVSIYETLTDNQKKVIDYMMEMMIKTGDLPFAYEQPKQQTVEREYTPPTYEEIKAEEKRQWQERISKSKTQ